MAEEKNQGAGTATVEASWALLCLSIRVRQEEGWPHCSQVSAQFRSCRWPSDCLSKLAINASTLTDSDWLQLKPHAGWASERFRDAITRAARAVGFQKKITDLHSYVEHLLGVLSEPQSSVAA